MRSFTPTLFIPELSLTSFPRIQILELPKDLKTTVKALSKVAMIEICFIVAVCYNTNMARGERVRPNIANKVNSGERIVTNDEATTA